jgi:hypothetical protein
MHNLDDEFMRGLTEPAPPTPRWALGLMAVVLACLFIGLALAWWYA